MFIIPPFIKNNLTIPLHNQHIVLFCFIELYTNIRLYIIFLGLLFFTPHYVSKCHMLLCLAVVFFFVFFCFFCCIIFFCENKLSGIVSVFLLQTVLFWIFFYLSPVVMLRNYESSYILKWNCWAMRSSKIYLYKIMPNSFPKLLCIAFHQQCWSVLIDSYPPNICYCQISLFLLI